MKNQNYEDIRIPEELSLAVKKGIEKGKQQDRKARRMRISISMVGGMAAAFILFFTYCFANPAFAAELPIIGKIFAQTESKGMFPGDYSKKAHSLDETLDDFSDDNTENSESISEDEALQKMIRLYGATDQDVTIVPEEVYCDGASLYIALRLILPENQTFGLNLDNLNPEWYNLDYCLVQIMGSCSDGITEERFNVWLTGGQEKSNTFIGRMKIPFQTINLEAKEISINITNLFWENLERYELRMEKNKTSSNYHIMKEGTWNLKFPVSVDASLKQTFEINDRNTQGFGIQSITVTPYELQIESIVPDITHQLLEPIYHDFEQKCYEALGEDNAEEFLADCNLNIYDPFWYGGFAVFDQNGTQLQYAESIDEIDYYQLEMKEIDTLYFYLMPEAVIAYKCKDQQIAEKCCIYSYTLDMK